MNAYEELVCGEQPVFDSHVHFQLSGWNGNESLACFHGDSRFICNATGPDDWQAVTDIAAADKRVIPALGIHPWFSCFAGRKEELEAQLSGKLVKHIGECGLDKVRNREDYTAQQMLLEYQLRLAAETGSAVSLHCVRAWGDLLALLKKYSANIPAVLVHAYSGSKEIMLELLRLNVYISFSLFVLRRNSERVNSCLKETDGQFILLDTDFPYGEGQPVQQYPAMLGELYTLAAEIRGIPVQKMIEMVYRNGTIFSAAASAR